MAVKEVENVDPHVIFWVLLPPLLYEDSSTMNWHVGRRVMVNSNRTSIFLKKMKSSSLYIISKWDDLKVMY
jgi:hypothetical protein